MKFKKLKPLIVSVLSIALVACSMVSVLGFTKKAKADEVVMSSEVQAIYDAFTNVTHDKNVGYEVSYNVGKGIHLKVTNWSSGGAYINPNRFTIDYAIDMTKLTYVDKLISFSDTREVLTDGKDYDSFKKVSIAIDDGTKKNCFLMDNGSYRLYDDAWENSGVSNAIYGGAVSGAGGSTEFANLGNIFTPGEDGVSLYYDYAANGLYVSNASGSNYNVVKLFDVARGDYNKYTNPVTGVAFDSSKGANKTVGGKFGTAKIILAVFDCGITDNKRPVYELDIDSFAGVDLTNPLSTFASTHGAKVESMSDDLQAVYDAFKACEITEGDFTVLVDYVKGKGIKLSVTNMEKPTSHRFAPDITFDASKMKYYEKLYSASVIKSGRVTTEGVESVAQATNNGGLAIIDGDDVDNAKAAFYLKFGNASANAIAAVNRCYPSNFADSNSANGMYGSSAGSAGNRVGAANIQALGNIFDANQDGLAVYYDHDLNAIYHSNSSGANFDLIKLVGVAGTDYDKYGSPITSYAYDVDKAPQGMGRTAPFEKIKLAIDLCDYGFLTDRTPNVGMKYEIIVDAFGGLDLTKMDSTFEDSFVDNAKKLENLGGEKEAVVKAFQAEVDAFNKAHGVNVGQKDTAAYYDYLTCELVEGKGLEIKRFKKITGELASSTDNNWGHARNGETIVWLMPNITYSLDENDTASKIWGSTPLITLSKVYSDDFSIFEILNVTSSLGASSGVYIANDNFDSLRTNVNARGYNFVDNANFRQRFTYSDPKYANEGQKGNTLKEQIINNLGCDGYTGDFDEFALYVNVSNRKYSTNYIDGELAYATGACVSGYTTISGGTFFGRGMKMAIALGDNKYTDGVATESGYVITSFLGTSLVGAYSEDITATLNNCTMKVNGTEYVSGRITEGDVITFEANELLTDTEFTVGGRKFIYDAEKGYVVKSQDFVDGKFNISASFDKFYNVTVKDEALTDGQKTESVSIADGFATDKAIGSVCTINEKDMKLLAYKVGDKLYSSVTLAADSTNEDLKLDKDITIELFYVGAADYTRSLKLAAETDIGYTFTINALDVQTVEALGGKFVLNGEEVTVVDGKFEGVSETITDINADEDLVLAVELTFEGENEATDVEIADATINVKALAGEKLANENIVRVADNDATNDHTYFITVDGTDFESILDVDGLKVLYGLADVAYAEMGYTYAA